ncbi:MAG: transcriptional regulator [Rhodobacterales bacterium]|nr:MAG: transcriptional regulator [Rhodobacterales bacterium]
MRVSDIPKIRSLMLFQDMAEDSFSQLVRAAYVQDFPPQVDLILEGDRCDFLHIVVDGSVELFADWNRHETAMTILRAGATFILAAAIRDAPNLMSARTLEKTRVIMLPAEDVRSVFQQDPEFARAVVMELAHCYRGAVKSIKGLKLRTSLERLANYLLKWQKKNGLPDTFTLDIEKRKLASILGMTPENLSRAIKNLRPYGVLVDGQNVQITDPQALTGLAKPSPLIDDPST